MGDPSGLTDKALQSRHCVGCGQCLSDAALGMAQVGGSGDTLKRLFQAIETAGPGGPAQAWTPAPQGIGLEYLQAQRE